MKPHESIFLLFISVLAMAIAGCNVFRATPASPEEYQDEPAASAAEESFEEVPNWTQPEDGSESQSVTEFGNKYFTRICKAALQASQSASSNFDAIKGEKKEETIGGMIPETVNYWEPTGNALINGVYECRIYEDYGWHYRVIIESQDPGCDLMDAAFYLNSCLASDLYWDGNSYAMKRNGAYILLYEHMNRFVMIVEQQSITSPDFGNEDEGWQRAYKRKAPAESGVENMRIAERLCEVFSLLSYDVDQYFSSYKGALDTDYETTWSPVSEVSIDGAVGEWIYDWENQWGEDFTSYTVKFDVEDAKTAADLIVYKLENCYFGCTARFKDSDIIGSYVIYADPVSYYVTYDAGLSVEIKIEK